MTTPEPAPSDSPRLSAIGPLRLERRIGSGGFSDVWIAAHPAERRRVAVKLLRRGPDGSAQPSFAAFIREADAVSRMSHPSIVPIHDFGTTQHSGLPEPTPYLVMEYFPAGSLHSSSRYPLATVQTVVRHILSALAHAHARGVLHLDIKPANVLRRRDPGGNTYVLSDFGAAALLDRERDAPDDTVEGTPTYMAPERLFGRSHEIGPWTDIYALGIMTWELCTGRAPFPSNNNLEVLRMALQGVRPDLESSAAALGVLMPWVRRATALSPDDRFRGAAEALHALERCDLETQTPPVDDVGPHEPEPTEDPALGPTIAVARPLRPNSRPAAVDHAASAPPPPPRAGVALPEVAPSLGVSAQQTAPLGLGLIHRRRPALLGREPERTRLWSVLREADRAGAANAVVIEGPPGTGKSRLATWLAEEAAECADALALTAHHPEVPGARHPLVDMVTVALRADTREPRNILLWARDVSRRFGLSSQWDIEALADVVGAGHEIPEAARPWAVRVSRDAERQQVLARLIRHAARTQPVVLVLDDAQWNAAAFDFADQLLAAPVTASRGIALVLTIRSDARLDDSPHRARIERFMTRSGVEHIELATLEADHLSQILRAVAPLHPTAASSLTDEAGGNPLYALQLLEELLESGAAEQSPGGITFSQVTTRRDPSMLGVWQSRLARALEQLDPGEVPTVLDAIELAAALGTNVEQAEWEALTRDLPRWAAERALQVLQRSRLCVFTSRGWSFAHALLRQSIEHGAEQAGRRQQHHRKVADWLAGTQQGADVAKLDREAAHRELAGQWEPTWDLSLAALHLDPSADPVAARLRAARLGRAMPHLPVTRQPMAQLRTAFEQLRARDTDLAADNATRDALSALRAECDPVRDALLVWDIDYTLGLASRAHQHASTMLEQMKELIGRAHAMRQLDRALHAQAQAAVRLEMLGHHHEAMELGQVSLGAVPDELVNHPSRAVLLASLTRCCFDVGEFGNGLAALQELDLVARAGGSRDALLFLHSLRCEALIRHGRFEDAELELNRAFDIGLTVPRDRDVLIRVHRCALYARWGRWRECRETLLEIPDAEARPHTYGMFCYGVGYASVALAHLGDAALWDRYLVPAAAKLKEWGIHEPILERCLADAGIEWLRRGDSARGIDALQRAHWGLGAPRDTAARLRVEAALAQPEAPASEAAPLLAEVSRVLDNCPGWLMSADELRT